MSKLEIARKDAHWLRVGSWRGDPGLAQITPNPAQPPSPTALERCLADLAAAGYREVFTPALSSSEQQPFLDAGFTVHERLRLLRHALLPVPEPPPDPGVRLRRARRTDRPAVLEVDSSAFSGFWQFDDQSLADASAATPSSRFRVATRGPVVGYAVTGRAGPTGYLQRLAVAPSVEGRGVGSALVVDGLRWAHRHGVSSVLVNTQETNHRALALYERLGFTPEAEGLAVLHLAVGPPGWP